MLSCPILTFASGLCYPFATPVASLCFLCGVLNLNKTRIKTIANYCPQRNSKLCFCLCQIGNRPEGLLQEKAKGEAKGRGKQIIKQLKLTI
jgi:hypothetical protein